MFSLKSHARRNIRIVSVSAAAASITCLAGVAQAYIHDDVYWDPLLTATGTGSGGNGSFDNTTANFFNPRLNADQVIFTGGAYADSSHGGYYTGDNIHFATTAGSVTVSNPLQVAQMSFDIGGYTLSGASITLGGGYQAYGENNTFNTGFEPPPVFLTSTAGNNTINNDLFVTPNGAAAKFAIEVDAGTLTIHNYTNGTTGGGYSFNDVIKTGAGTLNVTGIMNIDTQGFSGLEIRGGTVNFVGPAMDNTFVSSGGSAGVNGNHINQNVLVMSGATISGGGGVRITGGANDPNTGLPPYFRIMSGGHLSPGNNPSGSNFGAVGTFTLNGGYTNAQNLTISLDSGSNLDLDIASTSSYDNFQITSGNYSTGSVTITHGALVNISGTPAAGTYHIITETAANGNFYAITDGGLTIGTAPVGFTYSFQDVLGGTGGTQIIGVDLVIAAGAGGVPAGSGTWANGANDGKWTTNTADGSNWHTGIPNGVDQVATFDDTVTNGPGTVDLDGNKTVGGIVLNTASNGYTLGLPSTTNILTLQTSTGDATITVMGGASHTINAPVSLASTTDVSLASGTKLTLAAAVTGAGNLNVSGSGTLIVSAANSYGTTTLNGGTLGGSGSIAGSVVAGSGPHTIFPSAGLSPTSNTTLTLGGLTTNSNTTLKFNLITPGASSVNDVLNVTGNLNVTGGVTLDFTNHTTGAAGVGYYKIIQYGSLTGSVSNFTVPATANSIAYFVTTSQDAGFVDVHRGYLGDANDSGFVDLTDLTILATNWQHSGNWNQGDFDGSGFIDLTDLTILASHWQTGIGSFGAAAESLDQGNASWQAAVQSVVFAASVPEPGTMALLGLGALGLLARKRKR